MTINVYYYNTGTTSWVELSVRYDSLNVENSVSNPSTCTFTVVDTSHSLHLYQGIRIKVAKDGTTIFMGYLDSWKEDCISPDGLTLHECQCVGMKYLADRLALPKYEWEDVNPATIVAWVGDQLAPDGVTYRKTTTVDAMANGGFETNLDGWQVWGGSSQERSTAWKSSGSYSCLFHVNGSVTPRHYYLLDPLILGATYIFRFTVKAVGAGNFNWGIWEYNGDWTQYHQEVVALAAGEERSFEQSLTIGNADPLMLQLAYNSSTCDYYVDDVSIKTTGATTPTVYEPILVPLSTLYPAADLLYPLDFTISSYKVEYDSATEVLDDMAARCDYYWLIDDAKVLYFAPKNQFAAPWTVTKPDILAETADLEVTNQTYRNKMIVEKCMYLTGERVKSFESDGRQMDFDLGDDLAKEPSVWVSTTREVTTYETITEEYTYTDPAHDLPYEGYQFGAAISYWHYTSVYGAPMAENSYFEGFCKAMAGKYGGGSPEVVVVLGVIEAGGVCYLGFPAPASPPASCRFDPTDYHEAMLTYFDTHGIKAILQFEPGLADSNAVIRVVLDRYHHHPCVIGIGIDCEWHHTDTPVGHGDPVTDNQAQSWVLTTREYSSSYVLALTHWVVASHMPPTFRDCIFLFDGSNAGSLAALKNGFDVNWCSQLAGGEFGIYLGYNEDWGWTSGYTDPFYSLTNEMLDVDAEVKHVYWTMYHIHDLDDTWNLNQAEQEGGGGESHTTTTTTTYTNTQMVTETVQYPVGIRDLEEGFEWYWSKGDSVVSHSTDYDPVPEGGVITIKYQGYYYDSLTTQNDTEIASRAATEGTSGVVCVVEAGNQDLVSTDALSLCQLLINVYKGQSYRLSFKTLRSGLKPGLSATVNIPEYNLNLPMLIERVVQSGNPHKWVYTVDCISGPISRDWSKIFNSQAGR